MCKFTSGLSSTWSRIYGGTTTDFPRDVVIVPSGDIFALGHTDCSGTVTGPNNVGTGDWVLKTNSAGTIQDAQIVSQEFFDNTKTIYGIGLSCDNQILICGESGGLQGTSAIVTKMTTSLSSVWTFFTSPSVTIEKAAFDVTAAGSNSYVVVGKHISTSKLSDFYIAKLSADPGCGGTTTFCIKATTVTCGQYLSGQTTVGETNSISSYPCAPNSTFPGNDKVYKIVLTQTSDLQIGLDITSGVDLDLFLLSNNCTTVTCLDYSTTPNSATNKEGIIKSLSPGTYYIVVDSDNSAVSGTFNIDFACSELNCSAPVTLTCGTPYTSTTVGSTNNVSIYRQAAAIADDVPPKQIDVNNSGPEKLHKFTITQQSTVTITLSGVSASVDLEMFLLSSCSKDNCIAKSTNAAGQNEVITMLLNAGTYYISVDGFRNNSGAYTLTVDCGGCPAPPNNFNCNIIKCYYSGNGSNLQYTFTANQSIAAGYNWKITGSNLNVTGGSGTSYSYNFPSPGSYQVCFPYLLANGCVEYCCISICVANPFDCDNSITPTYDYNATGWRFTLGGTGFSDIQWRNDATGQYVGTGSQSNLIPVPVPCSSSTAQSVSAIYFDGSCYRVCCFKYYPCNPFDCGLITYSYDATLSGYRFQLNTVGGFDASTISWKVDYPVSQSLGSGSIQSNLLPVPVSCDEYRISVRFKDGLGAWVICCIRVSVCNPFNCLEYSYNYMSAANGYQFTLNASGTSNISWTVDDAPGGPLNIGNGATSSIYPVPGTCVVRTITVRYSIGGKWYLCCRKVYLCNPTECAGEITSTWTIGGQITLSIGAAFQNVQWKLNSGTVLGSGNSITIPNPGSNSDVCVFYRDAGNIWRICCKNIGSPPNPASNLTFDIDDNICGGNNTVVHVPVRVRNFTDVTTFQMSVEITNGAVAQLESIDAGSLQGTGQYLASSSTVGSLLWYNTPAQTVADNTIICTLNIRLTGNANATTQINITGTPTSIYAEQSIAGVSTPVTPVVLGGSVCVSSNFSISGHILREDNAGVGNAIVHLTGSSTQNTTTDSQGNYSFPSLAAGGNYVITPEKDIADINGVNGGDLVAIQRDILGLALLATPYKRIAGDANKSNSINGGDLVAIQRLILALDPSFPSNTSWLFVDKKFVFANPNMPWAPAYPQSLTYSNLSNDVTDADFTGVKIGDVNLTNNPANFGNELAEDRLESGLWLETENRLIDGAGKSMMIPLRIARNCNLESFQFTIQFEPATLKFLSASGSERISGLDANNMNLTRASEGLLTFVWAAADGKPLIMEQGDLVLWLEFEVPENAVSPSFIHDLLQLNGKLTPAIATIVGGQETGISLVFSKEASVGMHYFIAPNPFSDKTSLYLFLPEKQTVHISLFNTMGIEVWSQESILHSGDNTIPIVCTSCKEDQMLFYHLQVGNEHNTGKLFFSKNAGH